MMGNGHKIVVIGGGSTYTPKLVQGLIDRQDELIVEELWLVDIPAGEEKLHIIASFVSEMIERQGSSITLHTTTNRKEALVDANFVITQLRVGGLEARLHDETIPGKYHMLGQESIGIGGMFQALRTIPVIFDIIEDIKQYCPFAWLINVSNPTGIISEAVMRYADFERYIGVSTITNYMANFFAKKLDAKEKDIIPYFVGLYQMSYVKSIYYKHRNNLQSILADMDETELRFKHDGTPAWDGNFIKSLGAYPGPYLKYYYHYEEMLERYLTHLKEHKTRAEQVIKIEQDVLQALKDHSYDVQDSERGGTYYSDVACSVIASIATDKRDYQVLIVPNNRVTSDLPQDSAIEVTCRVTKHGPVPVYIGTLPLEIKGLIQHMKSYEELLVDAIYERDLNKALFAFMNNPLTRSMEQAKQAFEELKDVHKDYLTYYEDHYE